ncbi:hypothetical protein PORY_000252 [Pneumocystis oryctolagi]|uniref:Uncharacterized protein n=1 Tax=Pneumocystis oryctolagi TaxID=42067 RepID=A0ACB7CES5_9ASCO|nr:hypothetical protein PORY_000252 [Pneumocystis oryctolagi]
MEETSEYEFSDEEGLRSILEEAEAIFQELEIETTLSEKIDSTQDTVNHKEKYETSSGLVQKTLLGDIIQKKSNNSITETVEIPTHHEIDKASIKTWIYPTNVSERSYQFNIVQKALYQNTLVSLPTGLGKTFIAAVLMLNYYRWFPKSKIIFIAPTKPLVSQQIEACYNICGIPQEDIVELSGNVKPVVRSSAWEEKRVFFMTPQALQNDLESGICNKKSIVCLVVDEAHRATGNYAYCNVVRMIRSENKSFRILALTATPGTDVDSVQEVINSLCIARIELRTEDSIDIRGYIHNRVVETILVPLSQELIILRDLYGEIIKPFLQKLNSVNAYHVQDPGELTTFGLMQAQRSFMKAPSMVNAPFNKKREFYGLFSFLSSLAYPMSLLICHGINPFYTKIKDLINSKSSGKYKTFFKNNEKLRQIISITDDLKSKPSFIGHPKLDKLRSLVLNHFVNADSKNEETRAMIFVEYRSSAEDIIGLLKEHYPLIKAQLFVGQSSSKSSLGMSQKEQISIVEKFKNGSFNTLVATSIGEEGLDIGEVDLIICYDSTSSSTRLLQRMGRTGRKRQGHIYILLSAGREERSYFRAKESYKIIQKTILNGNLLELQKTKSSRIIPNLENPECQKQEIIVKKITPTDLNHKYIKQNKLQRQKRKVVLPVYKNQFISASALHKQIDKNNESQDETMNNELSNYSVQHLYSEEKMHLDHDIKIVKTQPLSRKNIILFPVSTSKYELNSVNYVSHSRICQRLIQTMQKFQCIKTYKTGLNNNFIDNNKINTFKFRSIMAKNSNNSKFTKKDFNLSQYSEQKNLNKQKSKNLGLKEIQKEQTFTYKSPPSTVIAQPKYFNRLKRRNIINESDEEDNLDLPDISNLTYLLNKKQKNEENIYRNANILEPDRYPDGNIRTLNDEDIAYFKWSESFKLPKSNHTTYIVSNENKTKLLEENGKLQEELKPHIPFYSKFVRNDQELFQRYGEKYKIIIETEDALDSYYYEISQKNDDFGKVDEKKIKINYWPVIPIRI